MVLVARVQLVVVAFVVVLGLAGGVAMQLELWHPGPAWSAEHYTRMLVVHGTLGLAVGAPVLAGSFGYVAIGERRVVAPALAWVGFGLWMIGVVATAILVALAMRDTADTGWTMYTPYQTGTAEMFPDLARAGGALAFALATLVFAVHLGLVASARRDAVAAAFVLAIGVAGLAALVGACTHVATGSYAQHATAIAAVVLAILALTRGEASWPARVLVVAGVVPALLVYAIARVWGSSTDLHVHDTYVETAAYHALVAVVAFASLAAVHAWAAAILGRVPHVALACGGAIASSGGTVVHLYASMQLGAHGMPRRYWDYDPQLTFDHQLGGIGAAIAIGGLLVMIVAWAIGARK